MDTQTDHVVEVKVGESLGEVTGLGGDPHAPRHVLPWTPAHTHTHTHTTDGATCAACWCVQKHKEAEQPTVNADGGLDSDGWTGLGWVDWTWMGGLTQMGHEKKSAQIHL